MQDFARLRIGKRIECFCLSLGEKTKYTLGDGRIEPQKQHGRDDPVAAERRAIPGDSRIGINPMAGLRHQHIEIGGGAPADFIEKLVRTFDRRDAGCSAPDGAPPRPESMSERIALRRVPVLAKNRHEERLAAIGSELEVERSTIRLKTGRWRPEPQFRPAL